jgi:hypothetical protein
MIRKTGILREDVEVGQAAIILCEAHVTALCICTS